MKFIFLVLLFSLSTIASPIFKFRPSETINENFVILADTPINKLTKSPVIFHNSFTQETYFIILTKNKVPENSQFKFINETKDYNVYLFAPKNISAFKKKIIKELQTPSKTTHFKFSIPKIDTAYAGCESNISLTESLGLEQVAKQTDEASFLDLTLDCVKGIVEGVWDATGGLVVNAGEYIYDLFTSPIDTLGKTYDSFVGAIDAIKNIGKTIDNFSNFFSQLSSSAKAHMICSFIGSLGTDIVITVFTLGAGSAKLMLSLTNYLKRFSKIEKFISLVTKLGKFTEALPKQFLQKLAKGEIADKTLDSIEIFSKHNMVDLASSAVKCAL